MTDEIKSTPSVQKEEAIQEQSLLDDASTLLMFSKSTAPKTLPPKMASANLLQSPSVPTHINHIPNKDINSISTTSSTLSDNTDYKPQTPTKPSQAHTSSPSNDKSGQHNDISVNEVQSSNLIAPQHSSSLSPMTRSSPEYRTNSASSAAVAAAAALATAATIPLPLKRRSVDEDIDTSNNQDETKSAFIKLQEEKIPYGWAVPDSYIVDPDSGVITCICDYSEDDGFTIQCDHCYRWQHASCYGIGSIDAVPERYLCNACKPRKLDIKLAKMRQKRQRNSALIKEISFDSTNSDNKRPRRTPSTSEKSQNMSQSPTSGVEISENPSNNQTSTESDVPKGSIGSTPVTNITIRKKEHMLNPKDAYPATYLPIDESCFKDNHVELFIETHKFEDWIPSYHHNKFRPLDVEVKSCSESHNSRVFPGFIKLGLVLNDQCKEDDYIVEMIGEIDFLKNYVVDPRNHYRIWGSPKMKVLFHSHWPLILDQRICGNRTRFLRRSCTPNVKLATIRMPDNSINFVLQALKNIEYGEELQIDWQWDSKHPILELINGSKTIESLEDSVKYSLIHSVETILSNCECACGNNSKECQLLKIKKVTQNLYKSVKSRMNNRYKLNEILSHHQGNRRKRELPVLNRMVDTSTIKQRDPLENLDSKLLDVADSTIFKKGDINQERKNGDLENSTNDSISHNSQKIASIPFKRRLLNKYYSQENSQIVHKDKKHFMNLLSKLDESNISDIKKLPIPILIPISIGASTSNNEEEVRKVLIEDDSKIVSSDTGNALHDNSVHKIMDERSVELTNLEFKNSQSTEILSSDVTRKSTSNIHISNSKKKLSFADYRKKQQK